MRKWNLVYDRVTGLYSHCGSYHLSSPVIYNLKLSPSNFYSYIIVYQLNCSFFLFLSILKMTILCKIIEGVKFGK